MLWVHEFSLARDEPEKGCIKLLDPLKDCSGFDIVWVLKQGRVHPRCLQLFLPEETDGLDASCHVAPELLNRVGPWKAPGHADNRQGCFIGSILHH